MRTNLKCLVLVGVAAATLLGACEIPGGGSVPTLVFDSEPNNNDTQANAVSSLPATIGGTLTVKAGATGSPDFVDYYAVTLTGSSTATVAVSCSAPARAAGGSTSNEIAAKLYTGTDCVPGTPTTFTLTGPGTRYIGVGGTPTDTNANLHGIPYTIDVRPG